MTSTKSIITQTMLDKVNL